MGEALSQEPVAELVVQVEILQTFRIDAGDA